MNDSGGIVVDKNYFETRDHSMSFLTLYGNGIRRAYKGYHQKDSRFLTGFKIFLSGFGGNLANQLKEMCEFCGKSMI